MNSGPGACGKCLHWAIPCLALLLYSYVSSFFFFLSLEKVDKSFLKGSRIPREAVLCSHTLLSRQKPAQLRAGTSDITPQPGPATWLESLCLRAVCPSARYPRHVESSWRWLVCATDVTREDGQTSWRRLISRNQTQCCWWPHSRADMDGQVLDAQFRGLLLLTVQLGSARVRSQV